MECINLRFANILKLTRLSENNIWSIVKKTKRDTDLDTPCDESGLYMLQDQSKMLSQVLKIEQQLHVESFEANFENMTLDDLNSAASMFIYLNTCPGIFNDDKVNLIDLDHIMGNEKWFKAWFQFYNSLFKSQSVDMIILTLNRLLKSKRLSQENNLYMNQKLFVKARTLFALKYGDIQGLFKSDGRNLSGDFQSIASLNIEGEFLLYVHKSQKAQFYRIYHHKPSCPYCQ